MIQNIFQYDNVHNKLELNMPEILLVKEFNELMENKRNICKEDPEGIYGLRAFKEFTYIWLALDWKSPYSDDYEQDRHQAALIDSGLTEEEWNNPEFRAACRKYKNLQEENRSLKMLKAAQNTVDKFIDYFNNVDPEERDLQTGRPVYKVKDLIAEISNLSKVHEELKTLEAMVKQDLSATTTVRGGAIEGFEPD